LACQFCRDYKTSGAQAISVENFRHVARQLLTHARVLSICSGGEPYLHKQLDEILRIARQYDVFICLLSNGTLMPEGTVRTIVAEDLVSLHGFSVDGFENRTVEGIRKRASLPVILANIEKLIRLREQMRKKLPRTVVRYALMRRNIEELPKAVSRWGEMGVDTLECNYLELANGIPREESLFFHPELTEEVFLQARSAAAKYPALRLVLPESLRGTKTERLPKRCDQPWAFVMVDSNGDIKPCYRAFEALNMGNIYAAGKFTEVWNSPAYRALRATVNSRAEAKAFQYCNVCGVRQGWGRLEPHLGDEAWLDVWQRSSGSGVVINHSRERGSRS
jgi:radical SAM protein with 4Fe4S-binding SPASM domain